MKLQAVLMWALCASLVGCSCGSGMEFDAGLDAGPDAGLDSGVFGLDAGSDAGLDTGVDAGSDSGQPCFILPGTWRLVSTLRASSTGSACTNSLPSALVTPNLSMLMAEASPTCDPRCTCTTVGPDTACEMVWSEPCSLTSLRLHRIDDRQVSGALFHTRAFTGDTCDWDVMLTP